jgi:F420H(2)-dependent quinone reductase
VATWGPRAGNSGPRPLLYLPDGDDLVIASKGGHPKNPGWYHNVRANPMTTVQVGSEKREVRARVADAEERKRLWPKLVKLYGPYRDYQRRAVRVGREIPVVI